MPSSVRKADKTRYDKSERLNTRRETREVDELRMQVEVLERQLADAGGAGVGVGGAVGKSESREVKEVRKELGELGKKLARVEEERDEALSAKKSLAAQLSSLESSRASDTLTRDLKLAQQEISKLKAKLKVTEEEGKTYLTRLEQLEGRAETVAVAQVNRQKKEINEKLAKMEEKITKLEEDKVSLAAQFKAAKAKHDHLEALSAAYERDNQRLTQQLKDSQALSEKAEKALADARTMAKAHSGGCSAEEKTRLTERIAALEGICATLEQSTNGSISGAPDPALVSTVRRYHELLSNLRLSEDDVSNLLANGSDWPPVRASLTDSSLIDLLWLLNDQQDEAEEERQFLGEKVARLEAEVAKQKKRAEAAIAASYRGKKSEVVDLDGMEELRKKREELERELEAALADKEREKARAQEMIAQLEARASAFEVNASRVSRAESPSRMSSSFAYGTVASGNSQGVVDRLTKTINELNDQVAELRDENTTLLLKLVGVDE